MFQAALAAEEAAEGLQVQHVALIRAEDQAGVSHHQKCGKAEKRPGALRHDGVGQNQRSEIGAEQTQDRASRRTDQAAQAGVAQTQFKQNDAQAKKQSNGGADLLGHAEGAEVVSRGHADRQKNQPNSEHVPEAAHTFRGGAQWSGRLQDWGHFRLRSRGGATLRTEIPLHKSTLWLSRRRLRLDHASKNRRLYKIRSALPG